MNYVYKSFFVVVSLFFPNNLPGQDTLNSKHVYTYCSIGYSMAGLDDPDTWLNQLAGYYRELGIPVKTSNFEPTFSAAANILYSNTKVFKDMMIGASLGFTYSPASAGFRDVSISIDITGSVSSFQFFLIYHKIFLKTASMNFFFQFKPGIAHSRMTIREEVDFAGMPDEDYYTEMTAADLGFGGELNLGTSFQYGVVQFYINTGYRFMYVFAGGKEEPVTPENATISHGFDLGQSGFLFTLSAGFEL